MYKEQKKLRIWYILAGYFCHGSWEEKGIWYTIASQRNTESLTSPGQTYCFSMRLENVRSGRQKQQEKELWLSRPSRTCQREAKDVWTYRLSNQGNYKDILMRLKITKKIQCREKKKNKSEKFILLSKLTLYSRCHMRFHENIINRKRCSILKINYEWRDE